MKLLVSYGGIWKVSEAKYKQYLRDVLNGVERDLNEYGKYLGDSLNVTDINPDQANELLGKDR
jgi:hypothetical protein